MSQDFQFLIFNTPNSAVKAAAIYKASNKTQKRAADFDKVIQSLKKKRDL